MSFPSNNDYPRSRDRNSKFSNNQTSNDEHRINERIRVPEVRLIDEKGGQVGVVQTRRALEMAREVGLDLVEVSPTSRPPVCKILDYGKFKYEKKKKEQAARKKQVVIKIKEIQVRPNTDVHDLEVKCRHMREFLADGDKVKVTLMFRGREMAHPEQGRAVMKTIIEKMADSAVLESRPAMDGRKLIMIMGPAPQKAGAAKPKTAVTASSSSGSSGSPAAPAAKAAKGSDS